MNLLIKTLTSISTIGTTILLDGKYLMSWSVTAIISLHVYVSHLLTLKKENELLKEEIQYLTDSFHDICNPLTLIYTPLRNICNTCCPDMIKRELLLALNSVDGMNETLARLMGFEHLYTQSGKLNIIECELGSFLKDKLHSLQIQAAGKHISLKIKTEFNYASVWFDPGKISPVIDKFIANAIELAEPESMITLLISLKDENWEIKIDFPESGKLTKIYKCNKYRLSIHKSEPEYCFAKGKLHNMLINLCNGKIYINHSDHTVSLKFPVKCSCEELSNQFAMQITKDTENEKIDVLFQKPSCKRSSYKPKVVLVESNDDFRSYLEACLSEHYTVVSFGDGAQALSFIKTEYTDLVIGDTELYGMSGDELSSRLKTSCQTSIIPVILFGSHIDNDLNKRRASLADTFMNVPFNIENLKAEMSVLIKNSRFQRKAFLMKIFGESFLSKDPTKVLNDDYYNFINKVKDIVLENLTGEEKTTIKKIVEIVGMSRTTFYELWISITGEAPKYFIHRIRMEKSWELLTSGNYQVSEIPALIGMKDEKHFRDNFKAYFGIHPKEAIHMAR